jgi:SAM-dependent methyltransferase
MVTEQEAMRTLALDPAKREAFAERMLDVWNSAFLSLMISVGHQTGLFDTLANLPPSSSAEVAAAAGLNERYVREWLAAMVTGRIVDYDPLGGTYALPPEHTASLTRAAGLDNLAFFTQYVAMCGNVEQQIVDCFRNGGGVPYSAYPRFQQLHAEETRPLFEALLIDAILHMVPGLPERLERGSDVLDVGSGAGHAINLMAQAFPNSRFVGYDLSEEGTAAGRAEAARLGLSNARFEAKDAATLDEPGRYDLITALNAIHDQARPATVLRAIFDALRPGGTFLMQDIAASSHLHENLQHPLGPTLYTASTFLCMTTSLADGGQGLGTMWGEQKARQMLAEAGFTQVEIKQVPGDVFNNYYVATR